MTAAAPLKAVEALSRRLSLPPGLPAPLPAENEAGRRRGLVIGDLGLLVPVDVEGEVLDEAELRRLPRTRSWCRGLLNLRGRLVPAFDLHDYLGLSASASGRRWWLVLRTSEHALAIAVDALPPALTVSRQMQIDANPPLPEKLRPHVGAVYRIDGRFWFDFRHRDLFSALSRDAAQ